jgi:hypothetical protein
MCSKYQIGTYPFDDAAREQHSERVVHRRPAFVDRPSKLLHRR